MQVPSCPFCLTDRLAGTLEFQQVYGVGQGVKIPQLPNGLFVLRDFCPLFGKYVVNHYLMVSVEHIPRAADYPDQAELAYGMFAFTNYLQSRHPGTDILYFEHGALLTGSTGPCGIRHFHGHCVVVRKLPPESFGRTAIWLLASRGSDFENTFQLVRTPLLVNLTNTVGSHGYLHYGIIGKEISYTIVECSPEKPLMSQLPRATLSLIEGKKFYNWRDFADGLVREDVQRTIIRAVKQSMVEKIY